MVPHSKGFYSLTVPCAGRVPFSVHFELANIINVMPSNVFVGRDGEEMLLSQLFHAAYEFIVLSHSSHSHIFFQAEDYQFI